MDGVTGKDKGAFAGYTKKKKTHLIIFNLEVPSPIMIYFYLIANSLAPMLGTSDERKLDI